MFANSANQFLSPLPAGSTENSEGPMWSTQSPHFHRHRHHLTHPIPFITDFGDMFLARFQCTFWPDVTQNKPVRRRSLEMRFGDQTQSDCHSKKTAILLWEVISVVPDESAPMASPVCGSWHYFADTSLRSAFLHMYGGSIGKRQCTGIRTFRAILQRHKRHRLLDLGQQCFRRTDLPALEHIRNPRFELRHQCPSRDDGG